MKNKRNGRGAFLSYPALTLGEILTALSRPYHLNLELGSLALRTLMFSRVNALQRKL